MTTQIKKLEEEAEQAINKLNQAIASHDCVLHPKECSKSPNGVCYTRDCMATLYYP